MIHSYLVFFSPAPPPISWLMRRGFSHVMAAGYDLKLDMWVFYDPSRRATLITMHRPGPDCDRLLGIWARTCDPHVLRVYPQARRHLSPPLFSCTGAIKALLGVRSWSLWPHGLYRHLRANGAEIVEVPRPEVPVVLPVTVATQHSEGGPRDRPDAGGRNGAGASLFSGVSKGASIYSQSRGGCCQPIKWRNFSSAPTTRH